MRFGLRLTELKKRYPDVKAQYLRMPHLEKGMTVGIFGGSFNPPHEGHLLVSEIALRRLNLDQLWWMVTPGNPLKDSRELAPLAERIRSSEILARNPRIKITALEAAFDVRFTADTLALIRKANPGVNFVWVMGADNLATFHHWQRWREISQSFPIAVIDRPGSTLSSISSKMAQRFAQYRIDERYAPLLARLRPPVWTFIFGPRSPLSSSAIRMENAKSDRL